MKPRDLLPREILIPLKVGLWWKRNQIWKRITRRKKVELTSEEIDTETTEEQMSGLVKELLASFVRHFVPVVSAYLAGYGIQVTDETNPIVTVILALGVYGAMQLWSWVRKIRNQPRAS